MFDAEGNFLIHGREWGQHKYIRKEGNRYIYPEDLQKSGGNGIPSSVPARSTGRNGMPTNLTLVGGQGSRKGKVVVRPGRLVTYDNETEDGQKYRKAGFHDDKAAKNPFNYRDGRQVNSAVDAMKRAGVDPDEYSHKSKAQIDIAVEKNKIKKGFENARKEEQRKRIANTTSGEDYARRQKSQGSAVAANNALQKAIDQLNRMNGHGKAKKPNADITGQQAARRAANQGIASQKKINEKNQYQEGLKTSGKGIAEMESRRGKKNESRASSQRTTAARDAAKEAQRNRVNNTTSGSDYARRQKEAGEKNAKDIKRKIGYGTQAAKSKAEKAYNVGKNTTERILTRLKTTDIPNAKKNYNKATDAAAEGLLKATNAHKNLTDKASDALLDLEKKFKKKKR